MALPEQEETPSTSMLQARVPSDVFERFCRQRDRWGMSNTEILTRMLRSQLPLWEGAQGPPVQPPAE